MKLWSHNKWFYVEIHIIAWNYNDAKIYKKEMSLIKDSCNRLRLLNTEIKRSYTILFCIKTSITTRTNFEMLNIIFHHASHAAS